MPHYWMCLELKNAAPDGTNVSVTVDMLGTVETAAAIGLKLGVLAETIMKKEDD